MTTVRTSRDDFESPVGKLAISDDLDLSHLLLEVATGNREIEAADLVVGGEVDETMDGASSLTFDLNDSHRTLIRSGLFEDEKDRLRCIELLIDDNWWRSAKLRKSGDNLSILFEPRPVDLLRRHDKPRKMSRADGTRAEFARLLIREVKNYPIPSNIPELHIKQPIEGVSKEDRKRLDEYRKSSTGNADIAKFDHQYPSHYLDQPGTRLTPKQVRSIAEAAGLPGLAFEQIAHGESQYYPGVIQHDPGDGNVGYGLWQMTPGDPPHSLEGGNWGGPNSATYLKMEELGGRPAMLNPWKCAQMAKWMFDQSGLGPWKGTYYLTDKARAEAAALKDGSAPPTGSSSGGEPYYKTYYFTRGQNGTKETSWDALQRLAREVGWRCFVVGGVVYFVSEDYLIKSRPIATISEETVGVDNIDFDLDYGKKASTATVTCRSKRWAAAPGSVILVEDCGPADGRWLVSRKVRSIFSEQATVTLKRLTKKKPEPRSSLASKQGGKHYGEDSNLYGDPAGFYSYPIGAGLTLGRTDQGVDFGGAGPIKAIGKAEVTRVDPQGSNTGWPGAGGSGVGAMIVYRLLDGPKKGSYVYLAENIDPIDGLKKGDRLAQGQTYAHARGAYPFLEIGWASNGSGTTLSSSRGTQDTHPNHADTPEGLDFLAFLKSLQSAKPTTGVGPGHDYTP